MRNPVSSLARAAIFGFAVAQASFAAPKTVLPDQGSESSITMAQAGSMKIINSIMHTGNSGITETAGAFTEIDSLSMTCPKTDTACTIVFGMNVQASGGVNSSNQWAICALVDGNYVNSCPWTGELAADGTYGSAFELESISVSPGKHALEVEVYSLDGLTVGYYTIQYSLYGP